MGILEGKTALVSGVANRQSIAWGIARTLREEGARVALLCHPGPLKRVTKLAGEIGSELVVPCDVRSDENIEEAFRTVGTAFGGRMDILVHSIAYADIEDMGGEFIAVSRSGWNLALEVSAYSLVAFTRCARPLMKAAGGGSVVTISFLGGERVAPGYNVMGIAKAALESALRYLAYDLGPDNIRINAVSPGPIRTMSALVIESFEEAQRKHYQTRLGDECRGRTECAPQRFLCEERHTRR
jgi:enoyl-[acyl-carrier protein] reductase I